MSEEADLLFFDTFSHETSEELNLDLVQFPKSVFVSEIRIIPLGARVQGDFPGGVRLGATNPTQFHIDFFVNDLSKPGASTFEALGELDYCQNGTIHMECGLSPQQPPIPTDGLVLRGWYTTITLAVYGQLTQTTPEATISSQPQSVRPPLTREVAPVAPVVPPPGPEWNQEASNPIPTYTGNVAVVNPEIYGSTNTYPTDNYDTQSYRNDYYEEEPPKDPRAYHQIEETSSVLWEKDRRDISCEREPDRLRHSPVKNLDRERIRSLDRDRRDGRSRIRSRSIDRDRGRSRDGSRHRDRSREHDRGRSRSRSHGRDYMIKGDYRPLSRSRSRSRPRSRAHSDDRDWDRGSYKKDDYRRHRNSSYDRSRAGSYDKRSASYERRGSPYDKRANSYERKMSYEKRAPSYDQSSPYEKRTPSYEKRLSPYDKRGSSYERRGSSYDKQPPYDKRLYDKRHSPYNRLRDSNYDSRSPSRDDPRKRPRTPPVDVQRRPHTPSRDGDNMSPTRSLRSDEEPIEYDHNGKPIPKGEYYQGYRHKMPIRSPSIEPNNPSKLYGDPHHPTIVPVKMIDIPTSPKKQVELTNPLQEEDRSMDVEPFEPILSDEDICDDFDAPPYVEADYDMSEYCGVDDIIKYYNPFKSEWTQYINLNKPQIYSKLETNDKKHVMNASFNELCAMGTDLSKLYELMKKREHWFAWNTFAEQDTACKEDWVHQCEQLPVYVNNICRKSDIMLRIVQHNNSTNDEFGDLFHFLMSFCRIGLNFDYALSQSQPTYKIRHMKCGVRLAEALVSHRNNGHVITEFLSQGIDIPMLLLNMYSKDYMALSIRLMILKSLDACLSSRESVAHFLEDAVYPNFIKASEEGDNCLLNGYQVLVSIMQTNPLARVKFAINSLIKKLNTFELLEKLYSIILNFNKYAAENQQAADAELTDSDTEFIVNALEEILYMYRSRCFQISQPMRFLPVSAQFEINKDCSNETLMEFFKTHHLLEVCLYLLTCPSTCSQLALVSPVYELLSELIHSQEGLIYLYKNMEMSEILFKCLMHPFAQQNMDEYIFGHDLSNYSDLQILGLELAYRLKTLFYIEAIFDLHAGDPDENLLIDRLQSLYCLRLGGVGKLAVLDVLKMGNNIDCLLEIFESDAQTKVKSEPTTKQKSPAKSYAIDLTVSVVKFSADVPFLKKFGKRILMVSNQHDRFEPGIANLLQEIIPYLRPLEKDNLFIGDDVTECVEILKSSIEAAPSLPGKMITCLRVLKEFGVSEVAARSPNNGDTVCEDYVELKHRHSVLQLFSLDGAGHLVSILDKLCTHFDQPGLHTSTFASIRGLQVAQVMLPCLRLLDEMLAHVVRCRGPRFRDTTAAPILLKAYGVAKSFPPGCIGFRTANSAAEAAIRALLAYAQPGTDDGGGGDSIRRGPWTSLCSEVINYTMTAPYTFVPGLLAFSELLPLPLPMQSRVPPSPQELSDATNVRRMWSAHLHSLTNDLTDMIQTICVSSYRPVLHMLRRVCVQIADLAPNTAATVARAAVGAVVRELAPGRPATATAARVLGFLACLVSHAPVKTAVLHAMSSAAPKSSELCSALCSLLSSSHTSSEHSAARECAAHTLAGLCDVEVTLSPPGAPVESMLANSLPGKEALSSLLEAATECLQSPTRNCTVITSILRALFVITEHEYGFQQFRKVVSKRKEAFASFFRWTAECSTEERVECLNIYLELTRALRSAAEEAEVEGGVCRRSCLSLAELADLVGYTSGDVNHVALTLDAVLKGKNADEDAIANAQILADSLQTSQQEPPDAERAAAELALPAPDALVAQFAARAAHTSGDPSDERLTAAYWLNVPASGSADEDAPDGELVACDVLALAESETTGGGGAEALVAAVRQLLGSQAAAAAAARDHVPSPHALRFRDKRPFVTPAARTRGGGGGGGGELAGDTFRSRPPNTSRPPSLHVDDFVALEGRGAQPTGPTGYNKMARDGQPQQSARGGMRRGGGIAIADRGRFASATPQPSPHYRQMRGRGAWEGGGPHFGHFPPNTQYMMGGMGWGGARLQRGHRHRAFMR